MFIDGPPSAVAAPLALKLAVVSVFDRGGERINLKLGIFLRRLAGSCQFRNSEIATPPCCVAM